MLVNVWTEIPSSKKKKLESVMAQLNRLSSEEDQDLVWAKTEHEQRIILFEWVVKVNSMPGL